MKKGTKQLDVRLFFDKMDCIIRSIEDNMNKPLNKIRGGTISGVGDAFKAEYIKLRPHKKEWHLPIPMKKLRRVGERRKNE